MNREENDPMDDLQSLLPEELRRGLTDAEQKLLEYLPLGEVADFRSGDMTKNDPHPVARLGLGTNGSRGVASAPVYQPGCRKSHPFEGPPDPGRKDRRAPRP